MESNIQQKNMIRNEMNNKKRYDNIDLLKFIAIFMVITLHVPLYFTDFIKTQNIENFIQFSFRLISEGVLIFIFVNGFLIINKPFDLKKHIKKVIKVFFIMIFWGIINVIVFSLIRNETLSINKIIKETLNLKFTHLYSGHLWFLQNLISLYIFFPIIKIVHDSNKKVYNYLAITMIFFSVGINFLNSICQLICKLSNIENLSAMILNNFNKINPYINNMFLCYFIIGGIVFEKKNIFENKKNVFYAVMLGLISWIIAIAFGYTMSKLNNKTYTENFNYNQIYLIITIIGLYALSTLYINKNNNLLNRFITSVGKNTMGIYLIHCIILEILKKYINIWNASFFQRFVISFDVLLISWLISIMIMKIPKVNKILKI
ncbi:MAG: acyltransferase [Clostridia bacterium]|nr:acyltransferase [Clostridia bacterium]